MRRRYMNLDYNVSNDMIIVVNLPQASGGITEAFFQQ